MSPFVLSDVQWAKHSHLLVGWRGVTIFPTMEKASQNKSVSILQYADIRLSFWFSPKHINSILCVYVTFDLSNPVLHCVCVFVCVCIPRLRSHTCPINSFPWLCFPQYFWFLLQASQLTYNVSLFTQLNLPERPVIWTRYNCKCTHTHTHQKNPISTLLRPKYPELKTEVAHI